jgi:hypothetical protein
LIEAGLCNDLSKSKIQIDSKLDLAVEIMLCDAEKDAFMTMDAPTLFQNQ